LNWLLAKIGVHVLHVACSRAPPPPPSTVTGATEILPLPVPTPPPHARLLLPSFSASR
jgi:hypothetical protein